MKTRNNDRSTTHFGILDDYDDKDPKYLTIISDTGHKAKMSKKFRADYQSALEDVKALKGKNINIITRNTTKAKSGKVRSWDDSWFTAIEEA